MMKKATTAVLLMGLALVSTACTWNRTRINQEDFLERAANVEDGTTRANDLERILGSQPINWVALPNGEELYVYSYGDAKTNGLNLILFQISKTNSALDSAYFLVGTDGTVKESFVGTASKDVPWEWWAFGE